MSLNLVLKIPWCMYTTLFISLTKILKFLGGFEKINHKIFFWKMVFKSWVQSIKIIWFAQIQNPVIFLFFLNLDSVEIHCWPYFKRKFKDSPGILQLNMVQTNAHYFYSIWARTLKFETCNIESAEQVHAKDWSTDWPRKSFESKSIF